MVQTIHPDDQEKRLHSGLGDNDAPVLMENHDEAYHCWREAGLKKRPLVRGSERGCLALRGLVI